MRHIGSLSTKVVSRTAAVVFAVAAIGALNTSVASASSGGGCQNIDGLQACISAGANLEPDLYTPNRGSNPQNACERVEVRVVDLNTNTVPWDDFGAAVNNGCNPGRHGPWGLNSANTGGGVTHGHRYHTVVTMYVVTGGPFVATSSAEYYS